MDSELTFNGDFTISPRQTMRPGGWYVGFLCPRCRAHFAMMEDPTDSGALRLSGAGRFRATCPQCQQSRNYSVADMALFEAAQGGPSSSA